MDMVLRESPVRVAVTKKLLDWSQEGREKTAGYRRIMHVNEPRTRVPGLVVPQVRKCTDSLVLQRAGTCWLAATLNMLLLMPTVRGYFISEAEKAWTEAELNLATPPFNFCAKRKEERRRQVLWTVWHAACRRYGEPSVWGEAECLAGMVPEKDTAFLEFKNDNIRAWGGWLAWALDFFFDLVLPADAVVLDVARPEGAVIYISSLHAVHKLDDGNARHSNHVVAGGMCDGQRFVFDSNGVAFNADWRDPVKLQQAFDAHPVYNHRGYYVKRLYLFRSTLPAEYAAVTCTKKRGVGVGVGGRR